MVQPGNGSSASVGPGFSGIAVVRRRKAFGLALRGIPVARSGSGNSRRAEVGGPRGRTTRPPDEDNEVAEPPAEADRPTPRRWERLLVDAAVIEGGKAPLGAPAEWPGGGIRSTRKTARSNSEPETIRPAPDRDAGRAAGRGHLECLAGAPGRTGALVAARSRIRYWQSWRNLLRWATSDRWRSKRSPRS